MHLPGSVTPCRPRRVGLVVGRLGQQLTAIKGGRAHTDNYLAGLGLWLGNVAEEERRAFGLGLNPA